MLVPHGARARGKTRADARKQLLSMLPGISQLAAVSNAAPVARLQRRILTTGPARTLPARIGPGFFSRATLLADGCMHRGHGCKHQGCWAGVAAST